MTEREAVMEGALSKKVISVTLLAIVQVSPFLTQMESVSDLMARFTMAYSRTFGLFPPSKKTPDNIS